MSRSEFRLKECHTVFSCHFDDALKIELQRLASANQTARRMRQNVNVTVVGRSNKSFSDLVPGLPERGMNRGDHDIQPGEYLIGIVQSAIGQDIDFGTHQNVGLAVPSLAAEALDLVDLLFQAVPIKAVCDALGW